LFHIIYCCISDYFILYFAWFIASFAIKYWHVPCNTLVYSPLFLPHSSWLMTAFPIIYSCIHNYLLLSSPWPIAPFLTIYCCILQDLLLLFSPRFIEAFLITYWYVPLWVTTAFSLFIPAFPTIGYCILHILLLHFP